jgi:hypothetical protein
VEPGKAERWTVSTGRDCEREIAREIRLVLHPSADDGMLAVLLLVPNEIVTVTILQRHEEFLRGRADWTCGIT